MLVAWTVCCPSVPTLDTEQNAGRSAKPAGGLGRSRAHRFAETVPSASVAETVTPTVLLYQPFEPSGDAGLSVIVVVGGSSVASYAPMSGAGPRGTPRWSSG